MADSDAFPPARGDEGDLFREFNDELLRHINSAVFDTTPQTIEDACAFAWAEFLRRQPSRDANWRGWLFRVAQREAWRIERGRLDANKHEMQPLHHVDQASDAIGVLDEIEIRNDVTEALTIVSKLRPRLRRVALLRALGHSYGQIGELTGDSATRVHALVAQASQQVDEIRAEREHSRREFPPRAERLWELENNPPDWLVDKIGRPVKPSRKFSGRTQQRRQWRRAALALDDYRRAAGAEGFEVMTTDPPANPSLRPVHASAVKATSEFHALRREERDRSRER
jgi:DNA-directed RNA polymerase specialized sigma24 family protein